MRCKPVLHGVVAKVQISFIGGAHFKLQQMANSQLN
jgi:hypothetical protein